MNKQEIINAINGLHDEYDLEQAEHDGYDEGYKEAEDVADIEIQELRNSLHVYIQEACANCGYAPGTLKRKVVSGDVQSHPYHCTRCAHMSTPVVTLVQIMFDGVEVR